MEVPVGFLSRLSTDLFVDMLEKHLTENQTHRQNCPRVNGQTTLVFVRIDEKSSPGPQYAFYAEGAVDREMQILDLVCPISWGGYGAAFRLYFTGSGTWCQHFGIADAARKTPQDYFA